MAQLAIKGHATRGKEVIEILEMLGGKIRRGRFVGHEISCAYYINEDGYMSLKHYSQFDDTMIFTLEEFLKKFPYKVGDKVIYEDKRREITKMVWEEQTNTMAYKLDDKLYCNVINKLQPYKEENMEEKKNNWAKWDLPDGYEFQDKEGNVINTDTIRLVKKQPQYPQTCEECLNVLGKTMNSLDSMNGYKFDTLMRFQQLLIYRDAYWKIAGEQMGLDKPWEPDWDNEDKRKHVITCQSNNIIKDTYFIKNTILAFPTTEMRDTFYENFKKLIEEAKNFYNV